MPPPSAAEASRHCGNLCCARSAGLIQPWATMPSSTKFHRCWDISRFFAGSQRDGDWISPAIIAPSEAFRSWTFFPKYAWLAAWMP